MARGNRRPSRRVDYYEGSSGDDEQQSADGSFDSSSEQQPAIRRRTPRRKAAARYSSSSHDDEESEEDCVEPLQRPSRKRQAVSYDESVLDSSSTEDDASVAGEDSEEAGEDSEEAGEDSEEAETKKSEVVAPNRSSPVKPCSLNQLARKRAKPLSTASSSSLDSASHSEEMTSLPSASPPQSPAANLSPRRRRRSVGSSDGEYRLEDDDEEEDELAPVKGQSQRKRLKKSTTENRLEEEIERLAERKERSLKMQAERRARAEELERVFHETLGTLKAGGWVLEGHHAIGTKTRRFFHTMIEECGSAISDGRIVAYLPEDLEGPALYKNYHTMDGTFEDLEDYELSVASFAYRHRRRSPPNSCLYADEGSVELQTYEDKAEDVDQQASEEKGVDDGVVVEEEEDAQLDIRSYEAMTHKARRKFSSVRAELQRQGWHLDAHQDIGLVTVRFFRQWKHPVYGRIVAYLPAEDGGDGALWKNQHFSDGELEDLEEHEFLLARDALKYKRTHPQPGVAYADDDVGDEEAGFEPHVFFSTPMEIGSLVAKHTGSDSDWHAICGNHYTRNVKAGSALHPKFPPPPASPQKKGVVRSHTKYLVKWKYFSFRHATWQTIEELFGVFESSRVKLAVGSFDRKATQIRDQTFVITDFQSPFHDPEDDDMSAIPRHFFDPAYLEIDRVLQVDPFDRQFDVNKLPNYRELVQDVDLELEDEERMPQVLVKWTNLPYLEASWEMMDELPRDMLKNALMSFYEVEARCVHGKTLRGKPNFHVTEAQLTEALPKVFENGGSLRDYQMKGVTWMLYNWHNRRSSLLADEMGLGKTLQTVIFLRQLYECYSVAGPFLVVAPLSTLAHWKREFEHWSSLYVVAYHGRAEEREQIIELDIDFASNFDGKNQRRPHSAKRMEVVVTSYEMCTCQDKYLKSIKWSVMVVDEGHRLKNHKSKLANRLREFEADRKLLLTGTPLQNDTTEFWSLLNFVDPKKFGDQQEFESKFGVLQSKEQVDELHAEMKPYMLRRMKEDVEKDLPPKEETRVKIELTLLQKQYYRALFEKNLSILHPKGQKKGAGPSLMNIAMELRKCCNHPFLLNGVREQVMQENAKKSDLDMLIDTSGKLVFLDKFLPKLRAEGHRVLIFSQFKIMLNLIEEYLYENKLIYERIDGDVTGVARQQAIDRFQSEDSDAFIMLLSTRAGGVGINLVAADTVIIYDSDFNPQNDLQAQARCHRIGQKKDVKVYRLISNKTYEMRMFEKASHKLALDTAVLGSTENVHQMTKTEVEELLKKGAYDFFTDKRSEETSQQFAEATIDEILERNTSVIREVRPLAGNNAFADASYVQRERSELLQEQAKAEEQERKEIELDDPNFWENLGLKVDVEEELVLDRETSIAEGRRRRHAKRVNYAEVGKGKVQEKDPGSEYSDEGDDGEDDEEAEDIDGVSPSQQMLDLVPEQTRGPQAPLAPSSSRSSKSKDSELKRLSKAINDFGIFNWERTLRDVDLDTGVLTGCWLVFGLLMKVESGNFRWDMSNKRVQTLISNPAVRFVTIMLCNHLFARSPSTLSHASFARCLEAHIEETQHFMNVGHREDTNPPTAHEGCQRLRVKLHMSTLGEPIFQDDYETLGAITAKIPLDIKDFIHLITPATAIRMLNRIQADWYFNMIDRAKRKGRGHGKFPTILNIHSIREQRKGCILKPGEPKWTVQQDTRLIEELVRYSKPSSKKTFEDFMNRTHLNAAFISEKLTFEGLTRRCNLFVDGAHAVMKLVRLECSQPHLSCHDLRIYSSGFPENWQSGTHLQPTLDLAPGFAPSPYTNFLSSLDTPRTGPFLDESEGILFPY